MEQIFTWVLYVSVFHLFAAVFRKCLRSSWNPTQLRTSGIAAITQNCGLRISAESLAASRGTPGEKHCCTVLRIIATVVSLIDSFVGAVRKVSNKGRSFSLWKKYGWHRCFASQRKWYESGEICKTFQYSSNVGYVLKKDKAKKTSRCFLSEYTRTHNSVSGNPNQRILSTLARLWHWSRKHFKTDLL